MALMLGNVYEAFRSVGVADDVARKAAEEMATYESRIGTVERKIDVLTWMVGFNLALSVGVLLKLFA